MLFMLISGIDNHVCRLIECSHIKNRFWIDCWAKLKTSVVVCMNFWRSTASWDIVACRTNPELLIICTCIVPYIERIATHGIMLVVYVYIGRAVRRSMVAFGLITIAECPTFWIYGHMWRYVFYVVFCRIVILGLWSFVVFELGILVSWFVILKFDKLQIWNRVSVGFVPCFSCVCMFVVF